MSFFILVLNRKLRLIDLASSGGLARIGTDSRLFSGSHRVAQQWSAALRKHPVKPDGILYPARHDTARQACALFDLPKSAFRVTNAGSLMEAQHLELLSSIRDTYGFALIDA